MDSMEGVVRMFNYQVLWAHRGKPDAQVPRSVRILRNKHAFLWIAGLTMLAVIGIVWLLLPGVGAIAGPVATLLFLASLLIAKPIIERKTT